MLFVSRMNSFGLQVVGGGGGGGSIVTTDRVIWLDAGNSSSYPGSGTTWTDISGVGTAANATLSSASYSSTDGGGSLAFSGGSYAYFNSSKFNTGTGGFTIDIWFRLTDVSTYSIVWSGTGSNTSYGVFSINPTSGGWGMTYYAGGFRIQDNVTSYGTTSWWNMTVVGNGGANGSRTIKMYKNGVQAGNTYTYDYNHTTTKPYIGRNHNASNEYLRGRVSHMMYYNRGLSESEITQNFNALKTRHGY